MSNRLSQAPFRVLDWIVPPVIVPIALIVGLGLWVTVRMHFG